MGNINRTGSLQSILILGLLFFIFGFVTWLNGSLIPFLKIVCNLNEFEAFFVSFSFYIAYFVMAIPTSSIIKLTGYKKAMTIGLVLMSFGSLLHIFAAYEKSFLYFLVALFILAVGLTLLQTASNPYIVNLGPAESAAKRISFMGILNKLAGFVAPIVFTVTVLKPVEKIVSEESTASSPEQHLQYIDHLANALVTPYLLMSLLLAALAIFIKYSPLQDIQATKDEGNSTSPTQKANLDYRVLLGAIGIFFYVGVEVIAGDTIGLYGEKLSVPNFTSLTSYVMFFMVVGYMLGIFAIPKYLSQKGALYFSSITGILFVLGIVFSSEESHQLSQLIWGWSGIAAIPDVLFFVALLGLANALVWPTIWPLALSGAKSNPERASAYLIMGISGGAVIPLIFGQISFHLQDMQVAYLICIPSYLYILGYAYASSQKH